MPFDFFGFFNGPGRGEESFRGRSRDGPPFGHPDDCPEEYGIPQRATSWWSRWRGPPFMGRDGFSGPPFNPERGPEGWRGPFDSERGPEGWRGPPWRQWNRDGPSECENVRPEGWRGPPWWCFKDRGSGETGEFSRPEGWRGPPWMWNRDPGNFSAETGERRPEWRGPPWWNRDGPDCGRRPEGFRGPPWMWNRDGPAPFSQETGERSRPEWRGPPSWMFRGESSGNEGWRRPNWNRGENGESN